MRSSASTGLDRQGFSLVELMVVVVLIGIMTALIVPEMRGSYTDAILRSSGRALVTVCGIASSRAVSLNELHRVRLDPAKGRFFLERRVREASSGREYGPVRDVPGSEGKIDSRILVTIRKSGSEGAELPEPDIAAPSRSDDRNRRDSDAIAFYPDGTADSAEIVLRDRDGIGITLRINPVTSRVQIAELRQVEK